MTLVPFGIRSSSRYTSSGRSELPASERQKKSAESRSGSSPYITRYATSV